LAPSATGRIFEPSSEARVSPSQSFQIIRGSAVAIFFGLFGLFRQILAFEGSTMIDGLPEGSARSLSLTSLLSLACAEPANEPLKTARTTAMARGWVMAVRR